MVFDVKIDIYQFLEFSIEVLEIEGLINLAYYQQKIIILRSSWKTLWYHIQDRYREWWFFEMISIKQEEAHLGHIARVSTKVLTWCHIFLREKCERKMKFVNAKSRKRLDLDKGFKVLRQKFMIWSPSI